MQKSFDRILLVALLTVIYTQILPGQSLEADRNLVRAATINHVPTEAHQHTPEFLFSHHPSALVRYNPGTLLLGSLMWVYQKTITHQLSSTCIYSPTCSAYSISLIQEYGLLPGIICTADRLMRCNRLALYDFPENEVDHQIHRIRQDVGHYQWEK